MKLAFYLEKCDSPTGKLSDFNGLSMLVTNRVLKIFCKLPPMHFSLTKHVVNQQR